MNFSVLSLDLPCQSVACQLYNGAAVLAVRARWTQLLRKERVKSLKSLLAQLCAWVIWSSQICWTERHRTEFANQNGFLMWCSFAIICPVFLLFVRFASHGRWASSGMFSHLPGFAQVKMCTIGSFTILHALIPKISPLVACLQSSLNLAVYIPKSDMSIYHVLATSII